MSKLAHLIAMALLTGRIYGAVVAREEYDFNFDGHQDYRVKTMENGKADRYDVFIFNPETKSFTKDPVLSGTVNPQPDKEHKQVRCIWPGGHSGAIYSGTVYDWDGKDFKLSYSVRQTNIVVEGKSVHVRAKSKLQDGVPIIESIECVEP